MTSGVCHCVQLFSMVFHHKKTHPFPHKTRAFFTVLLFFSRPNARRCVWSATNAPVRMCTLVKRTFSWEEAVLNGCLRALRLGEPVADFATRIVHRNIGTTKHNPRVHTDRPYDRSANRAACSNRDRSAGGTAKNACAPR